MARSHSEANLAAFVEGLPGMWQGGGYRARCPAHEDHEPSLSVNPGDDGKIVIHCHAGCAVADVLAAMGKTFADLNPPRRIVAEYPYHDFDDPSIVRYTVARYEPKDFRVLAPGLPPAEQRVLYAAAAIHYARDTGTPIYVVEGEKDANALLFTTDPIPATTNVGGAKKWLPQYSEQLAGCHVRIVADADQPGYQHAVLAAEGLKGHAASIKLLRPAPGCKDISDHLAAGHALSELLPLEEPPSLTGILVSDVKIAQVDWAWQSYLPLGALSLIDGDPGDGKSALTIDLVARWSTGMAMPDGSANPFGKPVGCIMVGTEDDPEYTIAPRLRAAGCKPTLVKLITAGRTESDVFNITADLDALETEIRALDARIVVIDPVMAFLSRETLSGDDSSVRRALAPLAALARRLHIVVLLVRHLNKLSTGKALYRGGGSIAFIGAARAAYLVSRNPDNEAQRVMVLLKNNLAPAVPALTYELVTDPTYNVVRVQWQGQLAASAQQVLDGHGHEDEGRTDVQEFLRHLCAHESYRWADILKHGKEAGFSPTSLEKHRGQALVKQFVSGEGNRGVLWGLRGGPKAAPAQPLHLVVADDAGPTEEDALDAREQELADAPSICDICHDPNELALKWGKPHWVIRCRAHNPSTYRGDA